MAADVLGRDGCERVAADVADDEASIVDGPHRAVRRVHPGAVGEPIEGHVRLAIAPRVARPGWPTGLHLPSMEAGADNRSWCVLQA